MPTLRADPPLRTTMIEETGDLVRLLPDWWALWSRAARATPFQSPAWLLPWWEVFHPGALLTAAVRRDGLLVGLAPFYLEDGPHGRRLLPLGIGITDHLDVLVDGAPAEAVGAALAAAYGSERARWDVWSLEELRPEASARALPLGPLRHEETAQSACPVLDLPATEAEWRRTRAGRRWHRAWSRVGRREGVAVAEGDAVTAPGLLDHVIDLHARRWAAAGQAGVLAHPDVQRFHRTAAPRLMAANLLRLFGLRVEGRMTAAYYGLVHRGEAYAYLNGFDPAFGFDSPGSALIGHAMRDALARGCTTFSFLRGREPYKYAWGAQDRWNTLRTVRADPDRRARPDLRGANPDMAGGVA